MATECLSSLEFGRLVGISERKARKALQLCHSGTTWRGARLTVTVAPARGGPGGQGYKVARDSIPPSFFTASEKSLIAPSDLPQSETPAPLATASASTDVALGTVQTPVPTVPPPLPRPTVIGDPREAQWRLDAIKPILDCTFPATPERAALIRQIASAPATDWQRKPRTIAARTLWQWLALHEAKGLAGLMRKAPSNAGEKRVILSRQWDRAMNNAGVSRDDQAAIAEKVRRRVRSEWRSGTPSWPMVQINSLPTVIDLTRAAGVDKPDREMQALCVVQRPFIEAERHYRIVAIKESDAAGHAALNVPRITRTYDHMRPMDCVAGDVHRIDLVGVRADGSRYHARLVAWMDLATRRAWIDMFAPPKGQDIRTEHVAQSWISMATNWGIPTQIYIDNGGEYNWADLTNDISKLKQAAAVIYPGTRENTVKGVQRARSHNPPAKVIEGLFSNLERVAVAQLQG